jgi:hypothetical protein
MKRIFTLIFSCSLLAAHAQQGLTSTANNYTQDFDGMSSAANSPLPANWKMQKDAGTPRTIASTFVAGVSATEQTAGASMTTTASNGLYNYGAGAAATATDRAIGGLSSSSASKNVNSMLYLKNNDAALNVTSFNISFDVEKYRNGSNAAGFAIQLYYSTDGSTWTNAGSNFLVTFTADADNTGSATVPVDTKSVTSQTLALATPLTPAAGNFYLLWNYAVASGTTTSNAQALGIDNVSITANYGTTTPLSLTGFTASLINNAVAIKWSTTNEVNVKGFAVEKSSNAINYTEVAFVNARNSAGNNTYSATDALAAGTATYYRLKLVDKDGSFTYSKAIPVSNKLVKGLSVFPNPAVTGVAVITHDKAADRAVLQVVDVAGRRVAAYTVQSGATQTSLDLSSLAKGRYFVVYLNEGQTKSIQLVKE